jgi:hypothetical protein
MPLPPQDLNDPVEQQFQNALRDNTAEHWRGDAFHDISPTLVGGGQHHKQLAKQNGVSTTIMMAVST